MLTRRELRGVDRPFLLSALALLGIGLLVLYSASFQKILSGEDYLSRQLIWVSAGCGIALLLIWIDYSRWMEWAYGFYALNIALLVFVLAVGVVRGGAQRWLSIGPISIQPSEFAKITTILVLARYLGERRWGVHAEWKTLLGVAGWLALPMLLILKEPNLGTSLVFVPIALAMLFAWGLRPKTFMMLVGGVGAMMPIAWLLLADYQRSRLMVFLNPDLDPLGAGYTVNQSRIAIGSGGFWGKGWMSGTQNQLNFLPERHTDFIFSVVGEEWGFLGVGLVLALFAFFFTRALGFCRQMRDPHGSLVVVGLTAMLAFHVLVNTGMTIGMMPVVGLPLPFLSYGGSWMLVCLVSVGMILSIAARRPVY